MKENNCNSSQILPGTAWCNKAYLFYISKEAAFSLKSRSDLVWCCCLYQPWSSQQGAVSAWLNLIPIRVPHGNPEDIRWDSERWFSLIAPALCDGRISCLSRPGMEFYVIRWTIRVSWQIWNMNMEMAVCSAATSETPVIKSDLPMKRFQDCVIQVKLIFKSTLIINKSGQMGEKCVYVCIQMHIRYIGVYKYL